MSTSTISSVIPREPQLVGQTVVVIGGSAGIGFETARLARTEGANVVLAARNPERLEHAAREIGGGEQRKLRRDGSCRNRALLP